MASTSKYPGLDSLEELSDYSAANIAALLSDTHEILAESNGDYTSAEINTAMPILATTTLAMEIRALRLTIAAGQTKPNNSSIEDV